MSSAKNDVRHSAPTDAANGVANDALGAATAGTLLRTAREANGLSVGALAAMLKVGQRKLEALEADRLGELPDATFARALAQTVCKALKIDPGPVLAALPRTHVHRLEQLGVGINTPFRARDGRAMARNGGASSLVWWWGAAAIVAAAALVVLVPTSWWAAVRSGHGVRPPDAAGASASNADGSAAMVDGTDAAAPGASGASLGTALRPPVTGDAAALAPTAGEPAASAVTALTGGTGVTGGLSGGTGGITGSVTGSLTNSAAPRASTGAILAPTAAASDASLQLHARAESWVQVQDGSGRTLLSRTLAEGEQVALDGAPPLKLKIGNALGTDVRFRGSAVDLLPSTRDNVARLEIKP